VVVRQGQSIELITKGAPEEVIKICALEGGRGHTLTERVQSEILDEYQQLSSEGFRVLAVASKQLKVQASYEIKDETGMTFVGFVAFLDPAKKTVAATLQHMHANGIEVKILTGDNDLVTEKIARDIGLPIKGVLTGVQVARMSVTELTHKVESTTIFARVDPEQKMRIIETLQSNGHVVGYMGDGINDAPSLKAADTGISVNNAVDIAKDTADLILMHKSLADLIEGVLEGRRTFANTLKYLKMALSSNFGNMFSMAGASVLLPFLPMLAPQILLNNLISDGAQITLPLDTVDEEEVSRPRVLKIKALKQFMWVFGPLSSLFDFITFFTLLVVFGFNGSRFQTGWFIESMATQLLVVYVLRTRRLPIYQSSPSVYVLGTTLAGVGAACLIALSAFGHSFHFTPLPVLSLAAIVSIVTVYILLVQLVKTWFYARVDL
jgi:Mg2+-importing ATPase